MIKKTFTSWVALGLIIIAAACSTKKNDHDRDDHHHEVAREDWKELDDFHMIMAEAFHPYKDSSNLEPAKQNAALLVAAAEKWAQASLPEKFEEDDEIKFKLNQLKVDASTFAEIVKTGDDKAVGESLTKLHDLFHAIQESWYDEEAH